jgi:23S rRNA (pseudouridine1915-N3)-methyltransferase
MLRLSIYQVGKTKEAALQELVDEYYKRLGGRVKVEEKTFKDEAALWSGLPKQGFVIALEVKGKAMDSDSFAHFIQKKLNEGHSHLVFLIGPAEGFKAHPVKPDALLSLSNMTFSHQTARLLLAEQVYRAFSVLEGKPFAR